jgi:imidazolonepropionase-like amidohydrolase
MKISISIVFLVLSGILFSQKTLFRGASLHIGNGEFIEKGLLGIDGDRIILVKKELIASIDNENWDTIIEVSGSHIYPAFVNTNNTLGLTEIDAVRATRDFDDVGSFNPHVRSQVAFNAESKVGQTVRTNGVLITQATPRGGIVSGTSSIMSLFAWNWEDATISSEDGIHLNWPSSTVGGGWWAEPKPKSRNKKYVEQKDKLCQFFDLAKAYAGAKKPEFDQRLEAMKGCFNGNKRVYIHANELQQIHDIIDFASEMEFPFPVLVGGYDAHLIGRKLKDAGLPVMLKRMHGLPQLEGEATDLPYRSATLLNEQGIVFCLQGAGDMEAMNARNLPFIAGTAMSYGLTEEQAIQSITLNPCKIIGIDKDYGSIEEGKKAAFFVSKGNALDMMTNQVTMIYFDGKSQSTTNFQEELYLKYKTKYSEK